MYFILVLWPVGYNPLVQYKMFLQLPPAVFLLATNIIDSQSERFHPCPKHQEQYFLASLVAMVHQLALLISSLGPITYLEVQVSIILMKSSVPVVACGQLYFLRLSSSTFMPNLLWVRLKSYEICYHSHQPHFHTPCYQHCQHHHCHWKSFSEDLVPLIFLVHSLHTAEPDLRPRTSKSYLNQLHITFIFTITSPLLLLGFTCSLFIPIIKVVVNKFQEKWFLD